MCAAREKLLLLASSQQAIEPGLFRKEPDFIYIYFFKEEKVNERLSSLRISYQPRMRRRPPCYQPCRTYIRYYVRLQKSERSYANTRKRIRWRADGFLFSDSRSSALSPRDLRLLLRNCCPFCCCAYRDGSASNQIPSDGWLCLVQ